MAKDVETSIDNKKMIYIRGNSNTLAMSEQITLETKLNTVFSELSTLRELMKAGFQKVENNFDAVKKDLESVHKKIELLTKRVEALDTSTSDGFSGVGMKIESLTEEIARIGAVTSYEEQFRNMEGLKN